MNTFAKSEKYSSVYGGQLRQAFVGKYIANTQFEGDFDGNKTVHVKRLAKVQFATLPSSYSEIPLQELTETDETFTLTVLKAFAVPISDIDYKELNINPDSELMRNAVEQGAKLYDTEIMSQVVNANLTVTDGDLETASNGGTTNSIKASKANIYDIVTAVVEKLDTAPDSLGNATGVPDNDRWIMFSPKEKRFLSKAPELLRATDLGDKVVTGGYMGDIDNVKIYYSNNILSSATVRSCMFGQGKPIQFAALVKPKVEFVGSETQATSFVNTMKCQTWFGSKVFAEGRERLGFLKIWIS
jgi:hypothetical protein